MKLYMLTHIAFIMLLNRRGTHVCIKYDFVTLGKRLCYMHYIRIRIFFSKVMKDVVINKMYVHCIVHDLSIRFLKMWKRYRKHMKDKKEIGRAPTRQSKEIGFA